MTLKLERIREASHLYEVAVRRDSKKAVVDGGGIWVGIQECEGFPYNLVLFNSPTTGSTLALKTSEITAEAVRERIKTSDKKFHQEKN